MHSHLPLFTAFATLVTAGAGIGCASGLRSSTEPHPWDHERAVEELNDATAVLREAQGAAALPRAEGERARCVMVFPAIVSGGLVIGATHGHGVVTCRTASRWSGPAFVTLSGGSAGLQVGLESSDLVMLVMTERSMSQLFRASFQLGVDTSVAAGPTGQSKQTATDLKLQAEILSYARTRGLFAGLQITGAVLKQDRPTTAGLYGEDLDVHAILVGDKPALPEARAFLTQVGATFPRWTDEGRPVALGAAAASP